MTHSERAIKEEFLAASSFAIALLADWRGWDALVFFFVFKGILDTVGAVSYWIKDSKEKSP